MTEDTHTVYIITDKASLGVLLTKKKDHYKRFVVEVNSIDEIKAKHYENDLNKFHASCGCKTGQHFLGTTIVLCIGYLVVTKLPINNWKLIIQMGVVLLIVAIIGKVTGKLLDSYRFKQTVEKLNQEFS